jgi:hypothetical protein
MKYNHGQNSQGTQQIKPDVSRIYVRHKLSLTRDVRKGERWLTPVQKPV